MFSRSYQPSHLLSPDQLATTSVPTTSLGFTREAEHAELPLRPLSSPSPSTNNNNNTFGISARLGGGVVLESVEEVTEAIKDGTEQQMEVEEVHASTVHTSTSTSGADVTDSEAASVFGGSTAIGTGIYNGGHKRSRTSLVGRALFPPSVKDNPQTNGQKRLSLPSSLSLSNTSSSRKSLSPKHTHARRSSLSSLTNTSTATVGLDLTALKTRLTSLSTSNSSLSTSLQKSLDRITHLEADLQSSNEKRKHYKLLNERLRCELNNRKFKQRWEVALIDIEAREDQKRELDLEVELSKMRRQWKLEMTEREELEDTVSCQQSKISHLESARSLLLTSSSTSSTQISQLRKQVKVLEQTNATLVQDQTDSEEAYLGKMVELEKENEGLKEQLEELERGREDNGVREKEVEKERKAVEKEKAKREKAEAELKELKVANKLLTTKLKSTETALTRSEETLEKAREKAAKNKAAKKAATLSPPEKKGSSSFVEETRIEEPELEEEEMVQVEEREDECEIVEEEEEEEEVPAPVAKKSRSKAATATKKKAPSPSPEPEPVESSPEEEDEESYRPTKAKSRAAPKVKEPKSVLADKTANTGGKKRKEEEKERDVMEKKEGDGGKTKKRKLFANTKAFDWNSLENANVNALGIPQQLSPIKSTLATTNNSRMSLFGKSSTATKSSLFSRTAGSGRPSIFG